MNSSKKPIRIAMVMGRMLGGGVESVVMNYYRHINRDEVQFDFIVSDDSLVVPEEEIEILGGRVYRVASYKNLLSYYRDLELILKKNKYSIIHSHINTLNIFPLMIGKKCGVPVRISHNHSTSSSKEVVKNITKKILKNFSTVYPTHYFSPTMHAGEWLFGTKIAEEQLYILPNAIEINRFSYNVMERNKIRKKLNLSEKDFLIGNIGRMVWQKNQVFIIKVFSKVIQKYPDAKLLIVGQGDLQPKLEMLVDNLNINDSVFFIKNNDNIENYYQAMDCFFFPSNYEGLGMVAIESQVSGLITLCSENVPKDVHVTDLCIFKNIADSIDSWRDELLRIIEMKNKINRSMYPEIVNKSDYNIIKEANSLVEFYKKVSLEK